MQIEQIPGGVARNICEAASRLLPTKGIELVSVVGTDAAGSALLDQWRQRGDTTAGIRIHPTAGTATVALVIEQGEIVAGVADTGVIEDSPSAWNSWLGERLQKNSSCRYILMDANLHADTLFAISQTCRQKGLVVLVDPVSMTKSLRWDPVLLCLHSPYSVVSHTF